MYSYSESPQSVLSCGVVHRVARLISPGLSVVSKIYSSGACDIAGIVDGCREEEAAGPIPSISSMTTAEWQAQYEKDGRVDLWMEEEFNSGSRLVVTPLLNNTHTYTQLTPPHPPPPPLPSPPPPPCTHAPTNSVVQGGPPPQKPGAHLLTLGSFIVLVLHHVKYGSGMRP